MRNQMGGSVDEQIAYHMNEAQRLSRMRQGQQIVQGQPIMQMHGQMGFQQPQFQYHPQQQYAQPQQQYVQAQQQYVQAQQPYAHNPFGRQIDHSENPYGNIQIPNIIPVGRQP